jgi:hypothetical protein
LPGTMSLEKDTVLQTTEYEHLLDVKSTKHFSSFTINPLNLYNIRLLMTF